MLEDVPIANIAHVIQLAVAPVFLLTGIGSMLAVMTNRLGRIVDRARLVERLLEQEREAAAYQSELGLLSHRAKLITLSISLCTLTALLVSGVVAMLFLGAFTSANATIVVAALFVAAMLAFIAALLLFLREIYLAIASLGFGRPTPPAQPGAADGET